MNLNIFLLIITASMVVFGGGAAIWLHFDTKRKYGGRPRSADPASQDEDERD